jgi:GNAT superfamily N-acetyltransferase
MDPRFRPATRAGLEVLLAILGELYALDHIPFDEHVTHTALGELLQDPAAGHVWLITDGADPVGYLVVTFGYSLEYGGRDAFIDELFVRESHRRHGIGTRALQVVEAACRERGIRALHLEVERANVTAQQVYRRAGFVDHDRYLLTKRLDGPQEGGRKPRTCPGLSVAAFLGTPGQDVRPTAACAERRLVGRTSSVNRTLRLARP